MVFHAPCPRRPRCAAGPVTRVVDKGAGKGALVVTAREISDADSGQPLATVEHVSFCRADGGFGAGDEPPPACRPAGARARRVRAAAHAAAAGAAVPAERRPQSGARRAAHGARGGFDRPILHGLCTYGMAGRALARACGQDGKRLASIATRFSAPFFPAKRCAWTSGATAGG